MKVINFISWLCAHTVDTNFVSKAEAHSGARLTQPSQLHGWKPSL